MRSLTASIFFLALFGGVVCVCAQEPNANETIRVDTRLVSIPVIVSDHNGRYVPNLNQADFTLLQDGSPQKIEFFGATEEPLTIALLIDTSQSTRPVLDDIKDSAKSFLKLLTPKDRAMIVSFDYDVHTLCPLTSDQDHLKKAVKSAEIPDGLFGTMLRDAAYQTVNRTFAGIQGRKAIIILTDGKDAGSRMTSRELLYSLQESDTLIYTIMFKTDDRVRQNMNRRGDIFGGRFPGGGGFPGGRYPPMQRKRENPQHEERMKRANEEAAAFLQKLSEITAGRFYLSKDGKLKNTFASIVEELRFQYRLGFYPPEETADRQLHELKVKVANADSVVRSRGTYRIESKTK
ncbi:hypothetical protein BH10ACI3_BH10ACI3_24360 [soil metagenome]